jgi:hypothetical protein
VLDSRNLLGWLLLGLLSAVAAGGAVLGVTQSPNNATLKVAVANTLAAPNYSEVFTEATPEGSETGYLTYEAPDRLGGYVESGTHRTYLYIQGVNEYQSVTVTKGTSTAHLVFYRQRSDGAVSTLDPALHYLGFVGSFGKLHQSGTTYGGPVTRGGQSGIVRYTVTGQYIGRIYISSQGTSIEVTISQVGTAPPIGLPKGARVESPTSIAPGASSSVG